MLHNCLQHREAHLLRNTLWVFLAHPLRRVEDVLLQGMCDIVGLPQLTALQRDQSVLPHRHGGIGLRRFNEDVATSARLSSAALACAALADGGGKGDPFRGAAELDARAAVESLRRSWWPSVKGLADSPDYPREWARCRQAEKTVRMAGVQHAVAHADADARAAAVFATLEADASGQASQLRAAALLDMARLRSCAEALSSAWLTARPGLAELTAVEFRTNALLRLGEDLFPGQDQDMACVHVRPGCDGRRYTRPGMRCSMAHGCGSSQHDGGCMAQSSCPSRYLLQPGATREAAPTATPCRGPTRAPFQTDKLTPP